MFHTEHVRVGNQVRTGYFVWFRETPIWIGRKVHWLL
jgi:hypothetical protein